MIDLCLQKEVKESTFHFSLTKNQHGRQNQEEPQHPQNLHGPSTTSAPLMTSSTVADGRQQIKPASNRTASTLIHGKSVSTFRLRCFAYIEKYFSQRM